jgi:Cdc6-like AAA superfamily ATPase
MITQECTLDLFKSVSTTSPQSKIEHPLSTTSQQPLTKKQQAFDLTAHVLKIIEGFGEENRTSLRRILQRRTNVDLKKGSNIETMKDNNSKLVKAIMGLDLRITTSSTYYDIITELEKLPTIISKEKKTKPKTSSSFIKLSEFTPAPTPQPSSQFPPLPS